MVIDHSITIKTLVNLFVQSLLVANALQLIDCAAAHKAELAHGYISKCSILFVYVMIVSSYLVSHGLIIKNVV